MSDDEDWDVDYDDGSDNTCSFCGGEGYGECDDPIQCLDPSCTGDNHRCGACDGRGYDQRIW